MKPSLRGERGINLFLQLHLGQEFTELTLKESTGQVIISVQEEDDENR